MTNRPVITNREWWWTCGSCHQQVRSGSTHYCPMNHGVR